MSLGSPVQKFYDRLLRILHQSFDESWYLSGGCLAYFMRNYTLTDIREITITAAGDIKRFRVLADLAGYQHIIGSTWIIPGGIRLIIRLVENTGPVYRERPTDYERGYLQFPEDLGAQCDTWDIDWTELLPARKYDYPAGVFFDDTRRARGHALIKALLDCGTRAGIQDAMFLGFGNVLGYALRGDFLPKDDDIDMCINRDMITAEQEMAYLKNCQDAGLTANRQQGPIYVENRYGWFSIGPLSPATEHGVKACNWFVFEHAGYQWHSKGTEWINRKELCLQHATAKGIPSKLTETMKVVTFGGNQVQIPERVGACLDVWYPGWVTRKQESSTVRHVLVMPDTNDRRTWYIENRGQD